MTSSALDQMYKLDEVKLCLPVNMQLLRCGDVCGIQLASSNLNLVRITLQHQSFY